MASLFKRSDYASYLYRFVHNGLKARLLLTPDKGVSETIRRHVDHLAAAQEDPAALPPDTRAWLAGLADRLPHVHEQLVEHGLISPGMAKTLRGFLDDYEQVLTDRGVLRDYIITTVNRITRALVGCHFHRPADLDGEKYAHWLAQERAAGRMHAQTMNHYTVALRSFAAWLVDRGAITRNPFTAVKSFNVEADRVHTRRALTVDELARVIAHADESDWSFRGASGKDRAAIYRVAAMTGLRAAEVGSLRPADFDLDSTPPTVTAQAASTKARRLDPLPIHPDLLPHVQKLLTGREPLERIWPGTWPRKAWKMLKRDMEEIGIKYKIKGEGTADFHALRVAFISGLARSDMPVKVAMQLARHTDPRLTLTTYARTRLHDVAGELSKLPGIPAPDPKREAKQALRTGTDDLPIDANGTILQNSKPNRKPDHSSSRLVMAGHENELPEPQEYPAIQGVSSHSVPSAHDRSQPSFLSEKKGPRLA